MSDAVMERLRGGSTAAGAGNRLLVAGWLFAVCFMIWVMVGIGGYTRDSGSGLSIMNWDPIIGTLPPMSDAAWNKVFALYQTIPQYKILHQGMDSGGVQSAVLAGIYSPALGKADRVRVFRTPRGVRGDRAD